MPSPRVLGGVLVVICAIFSLVALGMAWRYQRHLEVIGGSYSLGPEPGGAVLADGREYLIISREAKVRMRWSTYFLFGAGILGLLCAAGGTIGLVATWLVRGRAG
mgnify:CR=1 FL=1